MPSDTNVSLKIFEKLIKYKDLEVAVTKKWHLETTAASSYWCIRNGGKNGP